MREETIASFYLCAPVVGIKVVLFHNILTICQHELMYALPIQTLLVIIVGGRCASYVMAICDNCIFSFQQDFVMIYLLF